MYGGASLVAKLVKNPPAMWETWVRSLGWEDPLEKGMPTHSSILTWRIPWGHKESDMTEQLSIHFTSLHFTSHVQGKYENMHKNNKHQIRAVVSGDGRAI